MESGRRNAPPAETNGEISETDCVAGVAGLELRNVVANYTFERSRRFPESSRIVATETIPA